MKHTEGRTLVHDAEINGKIGDFSGCVLRGPQGNVPPGGAWGTARRVRRADWALQFSSSTGQTGFLGPAVAREPVATQAWDWDETEDGLQMLGFKIVSYQGKATSSSSSTSV